MPRWPALILAGAILALPAIARGDFGLPFLAYPEVVAAELDRLGLADEDVRSIVFSVRREVRGDTNRVLGVDAWVRPTACPRGALVISVDRFGRVTQVYTRDGCRIPGV